MKREREGSSLTGIAPIRQAPYRRFRRRLYDLHESPRFQHAMLGLIVANFALNILDALAFWDFIAKSSGHPGEAAHIKGEVQRVERTMNWIFLTELVLNAYVNWFWPFIQDLWNVFDCVVIGIIVCVLSPLCFFASVSSFPLHCLHPGAALAPFARVLVCA